MSKIELPELPDGKGVIRHGRHEDDGAGWIVDFDCEGPLSHQPNDGDEIFTAGQLRARDRQIVEVCAKVFEELHPSEWGFAATAIRNLIEGANNG